MLSLISEFLNKQDIISKLNESEKLQGMGFTDVHTIVAISEIDHANVTKISEYMLMTRSAISKVMKRLEKQNCVERYMEPENQKEIYFRLTEQGQQIVTEHDKRHSKWEKQDRVFLSRYSKEEHEFLESFFKEYNEYLEQKIEELDKKR